MKRAQRGATTIPEIAEYQKLRTILHQHWRGESISSVSEGGKLYLRNHDWPEFLKFVMEKKIAQVGRIGKNLLICFQDSSHFWHIQLNSTGWFLQAGTTLKQEFLHAVNEKSIRAKVTLSNGDRWHYHDARTWGKWYWREFPDEYLLKLGPDWLEQWPEAEKTLREREDKRKVKDVLCDQSVTAGLGNYLSCEACWYARIHPHHRWHWLSEEEKGRLAKMVWETIHQALAYDTHDHWHVFKRAGEPCSRCKNPIKYVKDSGGKRGSYYCSDCQGEP